MKNTYENLDLLDLTKLSELSGVEYAKIYFRKTGRTKAPMELKDATKIVNAINRHLSPALETMGFKINIKRKD